MLSKEMTWVLAELMEKGIKVGSPWRDTYSRWQDMQPGWTEYLRVGENGKCWIFTINSVKEFRVREWEGQDLRREAECRDEKDLLEVFYDWALGKNKE